jgi:hypothetical protein
MFQPVLCSTIGEMKPKRYLPWLIAILAVFLLTPLRLDVLAFQRAGPRAELSSQPAWPAITAARAVPPPAAADLDGDGKAESLRLEAGQAQIDHDGRVAWRSPAEWRVAQALIGDLDRDGQPEVDLLVWRPFRPWPVDRFLPYGGRIDSFQDSQGYSCQIILITWRGEAFQERWAGSALAEPLRSFAAADLDRDGRQELVGLETRYNAPALASAQAISVWEWNGFGFSLLARRTGAIRQMAIYAPAGLEPLLVIQR